MAVASLREIRAALAAALETKLGSEDQQVMSYVISNPTLPTIWIRLKPDNPVTYNLSMGGPVGVQQWTFLVEAYCGSVDDISAQQRLDEYLSPGDKCVLEALWADHTLGSVVQNLNVPAVTVYNPFLRADGIPAIGAHWQVEIYP